MEKVPYKVPYKVPEQVVEKPPADIVQSQYIPPTENARQVSMLETLDDVIPLRRRSGATLFFVDDTVDQAANPRNGRILGFGKVLDLEQLKREYCAWLAAVSDTHVQKKCELFFDREHLQVFVEENRL